MKVAAGMRPTCSPQSALPQAPPPPAPHLQRLWPQEGAVPKHIPQRHVGALQQRQRARLAVALGLPGKRDAGVGGSNPVKSSQKQSKAGSSGLLQRLFKVQGAWDLEVCK